MSHVIILQGYSEKKEIHIYWLKPPSICVAAGGMVSSLLLEPSGFVPLPGLHIYIFLPFREWSPTG